MLGAYSSGGPMQPTRCALLTCGAHAPCTCSGQGAALAGGTTMEIDFAVPVDGDIMAGYKAYREKAAKSVMDYGFHMAITTWNAKVPPLAVAGAARVRVPAGSNQLNGSGSLLAECKPRDIASPRTRCQWPLGTFRPVPAACMGHARSHDASKS